jgi:hypothetical protein
MGVLGASDRRQGWQPTRFSQVPFGEEGMKNRLDRDCVLLDGKCDCWIPMKECKYLPGNVNETEKQARKKDTAPISVT